MNWLNPQKSGVTFPTAHPNMLEKIKTNLLGFILGVLRDKQNEEP